VDTAGLLTATFDEHGAVLDATRAAVAEPFARLLETGLASLRGGGKLLLFGNGGSAADAQHIAAELVGRFDRDRDALPAIALTTDSSALTAIANDYGYDHVFERQIRALGRAGDVAIGISTSGNSPSVVKALAAARALDILPAGLAGRDGGAMREIADPLLIVPSHTTARIQEMHILIGHLLCAGLERGLGLAPRA
jgi:D-sedoheptulose 7-phosphate isomerase